MPPDDDRASTAPGAPGLVAHAADLELARAARAGEEAAFQQLSLRLACVPRYVSAWNRRERLGLDEAEVSDVCQEVLILAWRKLESFHGGASLETWAFGLAQGQVRNAVRAKRRHARRFGAGDPDQPRAPGPDGGSPFALSDDDSAIVRAAVDELPAAEAAVVRRKHFEGQTFEELALDLGISPNTAKSRYYRALVRLTVALRRFRGGG
ncbi:MAG: sigma-70 family RNA polymerase sigma factor [Planctomycetes bacterium]|nr:sigma-70 family RNA polymerase sigma factor [Planctomycetota bacterium]